MTRGIVRTDGSDAAIVDYLVAHRADLSTPDRPVQFVSATWARHLPDGLPAEVRGLPDELAGDIDRSTLRGMAAASGTKVGRHRLFLGSLVWGLGKSNARMLPGLAAALGHPKLDATLRSTQKLVRDGYPAEAYDAWLAGSIPGLREPFFTKWLFATGLSGVPNAALRPLVADGRVWKALGALGWSSVRTTGAPYRHRPSAGYAAYLAAVDRWAHWLSRDGAEVTVDDIEHFLFRYGEALPD